MEEMCCKFNLGTETGCLTTSCCEFNPEKEHILHNKHWILRNRFNKKKRGRDVCYFQFKRIACFICNSRKSELLSSNRKEHEVRNIYLYIYLDTKDYLKCTSKMSTSQGRGWQMYVCCTQEDSRERGGRGESLTASKSTQNSITMWSTLTHLTGSHHTKIVLSMQHTLGGH